MGHVVFTGEALHFSPQRGMDYLKSNEWSESSDFISSYEQENVAYMLELGKCIKEFKKFTETSAKKAQELANSTNPKTNTVDYINAGQDGYFSVSAKISTNKKRGQRYFVAVKINEELILTDRKFTKVGNLNRYNNFDAKKDAEEAAIEYALLYPDKTVFVINEKDTAVSRVVLETKYYPKKPALAKKAWRKILPAYRFYYSGDCYIG